MNAIRKCACVTLCLLFAGCVYPGRATRQQRQATAAEESTRYCDADAEQTTQEAIEEVHYAEPLYVKISTGKRSSKSCLVGAQLWIEPRQGMTAQSLERALRCHQARRVLEPAAAEELDLFSLADSWVDIQVKTDRGFVAVLRGQTADESELIDSRAQEFIARRNQR